MLRIGSVRLLSNDRNCFPFLVNALTSAPDDMKMRSATVPGGPSVYGTMVRYGNDGPSMGIGMYMLGTLGHGMGTLG